VNDREITAIEAGGHMRGSLARAANVVKLPKRLRKE
jgi:hypothetical protein